MRASRVIHTVSCHAEGEVGDVIVGGVAPPPGETIWEQSRFIARDETLRNFMLNEPRGGVFRHVNLLVPAINPAAQMGFIIMEPIHTPPMSGSNSMCVATVLLETGILPMVEPLTRLVLGADQVGNLDLEARFLFLAQKALNDTHVGRVVFDHQNFDTLCAHPAICRRSR